MCFVGRNGAILLLWCSSQRSALTKTLVVTKGSKAGINYSSFRVFYWNTTHGLIKITPVLLSGNRELQLVWHSLDEAMPTLSESLQRVGIAILLPVPSTVIGACRALENGLVPP